MGRRRVKRCAAQEGLRAGLAGVAEVDRRFKINNPQRCSRRSAGQFIDDEQVARLQITHADTPFLKFDQQYKQIVDNITHQGGAVPEIFGDNPAQNHFPVPDHGVAILF